MVRPFLFIAALVLPTAAAAGVGAPIAYSVGREVYLINQDGSGKRLVYRGATKTSIFSISMKKDGGEMSFEEVASGGQTGKLITIRYGASGTGTVARSVAGCRFHVATRDDGAILAVNSCDRSLNFAASATSALSSMAVGRGVSKATWMPDGSFLYAATTGQIYQATLTDPQGVLIRSQDCVQDLQGAHAASEAMIAVGSVCDGPRIDRMMVPAGTAEHVAAGSDTAYSSDDRCFIFVAPPGRRGTFLLINKVDASVSSIQLGNSANYNAVDWRADSQPDTCRLVSNTALQFRNVP